MKMEEILQVIKDLAKSQGMYAGLLACIEMLREERPEDYERYVKLLESQNFRDPVDLVLFFES